MTFLIDQLAEQRILAAIEKGELEDLPKQGQPLELDDDRGVPEHLRMGYRILKNAGYIPPELQQRKDALELCDLVVQSDADSQETQQVLRDIRKLELKMQLKGIDTRFIHRYLMSKHINLAPSSHEEEDHSNY